MNDRNGFTSLFHDRKIATKVACGFACVLTILAMVACTAWFTLKSSTEGFTTYAQQVAVVSIASDIDRSFLNLRRFVREYALTGVEASADSAGQEQVTLARLLQQGQTEIKNPQRHQQIEAMSLLSRTYLQDFDKVTALTREQIKLEQESLDPLGLTQRQRFEELIAAATEASDASLTALTNQALQQFMIARLDVNKLLGRHEAAAGQNAEKDFATLSGMLQALARFAKGENYQQTLAAAQRGVTSYNSAFHSAAALKSQIDSLINGAMSDLGRQVQRAIEAIKASATADEKLSAQTTLAIMDRTSALILGLAIGGILLGTALSWAIGHGISRPVLDMAAAMHALASGNLDHDMHGLNRADEIGQMGRAMLVFRGNAQEAQRLRGEAERIGVAKDRRQAAVDQHVQEFGASASGVMATLVDAADLMLKTAGEMRQTAQRTRETASRTAEAATNSAQNLSAVAAAAEEMAASIQEISRQVSRANDAALQAVQLAAATDTKVGGMADAVDRVGNVVRLISDIAGQTNLLALNATIEAARAGESGKGFAVVAGEVKALAAQTAKATEEISSQIAAIRGATTDAVSAVREVSAAIGQVNEVAAAIAAAVEQQSATTREIAASVQTVTAATQAASRDMQDVSTISESAVAASASVMQGADDVGTTAGELHTELTQFLEAIAKTSEDDRRRYERIDGNGAEVTLRTSDHREFRGPIVDISRGGVALRIDWWAAAGTEVEVTLPGVDRPVLARTARRRDGVLALAFRQDETVLRLVDAAVSHIGALAATRRAA